MYPIFTYKVDAMRSLQLLVSRGEYLRYTSGIIPKAKLKSMIFKMEDRYRINATKQMRYRAKQRGEANSKIVLWQDGDDMHFWLMVTNGTGAVSDLEPLKDTTNKRTRIEITGYELIRVKKEKTTWTWRLSQDNYSTFEERIKIACRHKNSQQIEQCFYSLQHMPVFAEMRKQCFKLFKLLQAEYLRSHKAPYPKTLVKGFYGRFKAPTTTKQV